MPILQKRIHFHTAAMAGELVLNAISSTWKVTIEDREGMLDAVAAGSKPHIATFWHRYLIPMLCIFRRRPVWVPVSEHSDGEYAAHIMERYGLYTVRGSTTRNSLHLVRELVSLIKAGSSCAITPDGPRGPKYSVQPGALLLARRTGAPINPIGLAVSKGLVLNSWDRLVIPKPFSEIYIIIGGSLDIPADCELSDCYELLRTRMLDCSRKAEQHTVTSV